MKHIGRYIAFVVSSVTLAISARAELIVYNNLPTTTNINGVWDSGALTLPPNTTVGPASTIDLILNLTGSLVTSSVPDVGANIAIEGSAAPGTEFVGVSYQLLENGLDSGPSFGEDVINPFNGPIENVGFGLSNSPAKELFNGIDVHLYNNSQIEVVTTFGTDIFTEPALVVVPESRASPLFITIGTLLAALVSRRPRQMAVSFVHRSLRPQ